MILPLGFDIGVEADNGHEAHCTIVQESSRESKPKRVRHLGCRLDSIPWTHSGFEHTVSIDLLRTTT